MQVTQDLPRERSVPEDRMLKAVLVATDLQPDDVVDLSVVSTAIKRHWFLVLVLMVVSASLAWWFSYQFSQRYQAQALLALVTDETSISPGRSLADQYGSIASLAGVNLTAGAERDRGATIAILSSHRFLQQFITDQNMLPALFPKRWDAALGRWKPGEEAPTLQDGADLFIRRALTVSEDRRTGLVTLKIIWPNRDNVANWANGMIAKANAVNREQAIHDATESIQFLDKELQGADAIEIKQSIYSLLETAMNKRMLATTRPEFSFHIIDPAQTPKVTDFVSPNRVLFGVLGGLLGGLLGLLVGIILEKRRRT